MFFRSLIFAVFFACAAFYAAPQTAMAQTSETSAEAPSYSEDDFLHTDAEIEKAYRAVKRNNKYQYQLAEPIPPRQRSKFDKAVGKFFDRIFSFLLPLLKIMFYLGAGGLILGAAYLFGRAIYETRFASARVKEKTEEPEIPLYQPAQAQARVLLDEVDKLAAEGRYGEAVHTLLFRSIQDIDRNRPNVVRRSLTAREIGNLSVLTLDSRKAFSTIAGVSELAHFGGVLVNEAGFQTARKAYADLTGQTSTQRRSRR